MLVYRLTSAKFAKDMTGMGAKLNGGRWNHPGTACIYSTENRALSILEYAANNELDKIPRALSMITFELPEDSIEIIKVAQLPGNWNALKYSVDTMSFGTALLQAAKALAIKIPSIIVAEEHNYLINPQHDLIKKLKIIDVKDFVFDIRVKG